MARRFWKVRITRHALQRWKERGGRGEPSPYKILNRIVGKLRNSGAVPQKNGSIYVRVDDEWVAVLHASRYGGWVVVTFLNRPKEVDNQQNEKAS